MTSTSRKPTLGLNVVGGEGWMGGLLYVRNLVACLQKLPPSERPDVVLIGGVSRNAITEELLSFDFVRLGQQGYLLDRPKASRYLSTALRLLQRRLPGTNSDPWYRDIDVVYPVLTSSGAESKEIFWIPDFQSVHLPELFSQAEIRSRQRHVAKMALREAIIVFSSDMAAGDFHRLYPDARATSRTLNFCSVVQLDPAPDPRVTRGLPERYLYVANQFWAHKNHLQILEALAILRRRGARIPLVCTGLESDYRNSGHMAAVRRFIVLHELEDQVSLLGIVPRTEQIQLFRYAAAVVQPSRFEGWSTVIEDAKAIGRPLYVSDFPVHREQLDDAVFFPLDDAEALADKLELDWPTLPAGPDHERERAAANIANRRQLTCAHAFMSIMREALGAAS